MDRMAASKKNDIRNRGLSSPTPSYCDVPEEHGEQEMDPLAVVDDADVSDGASFSGVSGEDDSSEDGSGESDSLFGSESGEEEVKKPIRARIQRAKASTVVAGDSHEAHECDKLLREAGVPSGLPCAAPKESPLPAEPDDSRLPPSVTKCMPQPPSIGWKPSIRAVMNDRLERNGSAGTVVIKRDVQYRVQRYFPTQHGARMEDAIDFYSTPTDLACLWCTEPFETPPIPKAERFRTCAGVYWFEVSGQYCSPSCALASCGPKERPVMHHLIRVVYGVKSRVDECIKPVIVSAAPPREALRKFGGQYTIEEFRATGAVSIEASITSLPFLPVNAGIEEVERVDTVFAEALNPEQLDVALKQGVPSPFAPQHQYHSARGRRHTPASLFRGRGRGRGGGQRGRGRALSNKGFSVPQTGKRRYTAGSGSTTKRQRLDDGNGSLPNIGTRSGSMTSQRSIEDQLRLSSERLKLQRQELAPVIKKRGQKKTLMSYMKRG